MVEPGVLLCQQDGLDEPKDRSEVGETYWRPPSSRVDEASWWNQESDVATCNRRTFMPQGRLKVSLDETRNRPKSLGGIRLFISTCICDSTRVRR